MRVYAIPYQGTITAAGGDTDLLSLAPATNKPVKLKGMVFSQISEVGDTAEEGLRITVRRLGATFTPGTGGSAISAQTPLNDSSDPVWGFTARCNDTSVSSSSGTNEIKMELGWNNRLSPWDIWFPDNDFSLQVKQGEALVIRLETTLLDDM